MWNARKIYSLEFIIPLAKTQKQHVSHDRIPLEGSLATDPGVPFPSPGQDTPALFPLKEFLPRAG